MLFFAELHMVLETLHYTLYDKNMMLGSITKSWFKFSDFQHIFEKYFISNGNSEM